MHKLNPLSLEQQKDIEKIFKVENSRSADFCFGNYYMWDKRFEQHIAVIGGRLVTLLTRNGEKWFAFPVGSGDAAPALDFMKAYCLDADIPLKICGICHEHLPLLDSGFLVASDRDFSDYIYGIGALSSYSGKHLHGKKNFCNRFEKEHEWHFEPMTRKNIPLCMEMLRQWHIEEDVRLEGSIVYENDAIRTGFENFEALGLEGGVLFADNSVAGFCMGEALNGDTFCVHFEKAFSRLDGAYPMVCREMAKLIKATRPEICYVNREDDMGTPSLRKSKLSYKPEFILEKHTAIWQKE